MAHPIPTIMIRRLAAIALLAVAFWPVAGHATTRYVAKHGSNAGSGAQGSPWLTIQYAVTNAESGDTILVGVGDFTENILLTTNRQSLTLKGGHNTNNWSWAPATHATIFKGKISLGAPASTGNTIAGLTINANNAGYGIEVPYHEFFKSSLTIRECIITNATWGIYAEGGCDFTIQNTIIAKSSLGGTYLNGGPGPTGTNFFDNCTFVTNKRANIWVPNCGKTFIRNTIVYGAYGSGGSGNEGYGIAAGSTEARSAVVSHSLVYSNTVSINGQVSYGDGMITNQAPGFVSYAGLNLRLAAGSPCIGTGETIDSITNDVFGVSRPQSTGYDMGAFEWLPPPAAPSGLTATAVATNRIDLSWIDHSSNENGFRIERKSGAGAFAEIAVTGPDTTTYQDTGVAANTLYAYRVCAIGSGASGDSGYSNEAEATSLAVIRYVAKHGNNANPGTQAEPWATIQYAVTNVSSRYVILVGEGLYEETVRYSNGISFLTLIGGHSTNDWSWNPTLHPTVLKPVAEVGILFAKGWEYNGPDYDSSPSTNPVVRGFTINGGQYGIGIPWCNQVNPVNPVTLSHCIITNQSIHSIFLQGAGFIDLRNSVIGGSSGVGLYGVTGPGGGVTSRIYNCTFVNNKRANIWFSDINSGHIDIRNSIIYGAWGTGGQGNEGYGIATHSNFNQTMSISYSLLYTNTVQTYGTNIVIGAGMITNQGPVFAGAATGNYHLVKGSPGVNAGDTIVSITNDLDLNRRPMGTAYDMGAYEFIEQQRGGTLVLR